MQDNLLLAKYVFPKADSAKYEIINENIVLYFYLYLQLFGVKTYSKLIVSPRHWK